MSAPRMSRIEELDAISKTRPLSDAESMELEREIIFASGDTLPSRFTRDLARLGIKRWMQRFVGGTAV
jgi:hypothetical protein